VLLEEELLVTMDQTPGKARKSRQRCRRRQWLAQRGHLLGRWQQQLVLGARCGLAAEGEGRGFFRVLGSWMAWTPTGWRFVLAAAIAVATVSAGEGEKASVAKGRQQLAVEQMSVSLTAAAAALMPGFEQQMRWCWA